MKARLIFAIISTLLEETALVIVMLWGLPRIGIQLPMAGIITLMVLWAVYSGVTYHLGSRALTKNQVVGLPDMVGSKGKAVSPLAPEGMVRIKGELWVAKSASGEIEPGAEVTVVGQGRLKLVVRARSTIDASERTE